LIKLRKAIMGANSGVIKGGAMVRPPPPLSRLGLAVNFWIIFAQVL